MSEITLTELKAKIEDWKLAFPQLTVKALTLGANTAKDEIKRRWSGIVIHKITGNLLKALKSKVTLNPLAGTVFVEQRQQYKAQTLEHGKTIVPKGIERRFWIPKGKVLSAWLPTYHESLERSRSGMKKIVTSFLQLGPRRNHNGFYGRPKSVTIRARPVFIPSLESKQTEIRDKVLYTMLYGYDKTQRGIETHQEGVE